LFDRALAPVIRLLGDLDMSRDDIDEVVLVGRNMYIYIYIYVYTCMYILMCIDMSRDDIDEVFLVRRNTYICV
jgi:hypothetical protein